MRLFFGLFLLILFTKTVSSQNFDFTSENRSGCYPPTFIFENISDSKTGYIFEWQMDNVVFENNENFVSKVFTNSGTGVELDVLMIVRNAETRVEVARVLKRNYVEILPEPHVTFAADNQVICGGSQVQFTPSIIEASAPIVEWKWYVSSLRRGSEEIFINTFTASGEVSVSLSVTDENGCSNILNKASAEKYITVLENTLGMPNVSISPDEYHYCENNVTVNFNYDDYDPEIITNFKWDFGNGYIVENQANISHFFTDYGRHSVSLTVSDGYCTSPANIKNFYLHDFLPQIEIKDLVPMPNRTVLNNSTVCKGELEFNCPDNASSYKWFVNGIQVGNTRRMNYPVTIDGQLEVRLEATSSEGCVGVNTMNIQVEEPLVVDFELDKNFICQDTDEISVTGTSNLDNTIFNYRYSSTGQLLSELQNFSFTPRLGINNVVLNAQTTNGCSAIAVEKQVEAEFPSVSFSYEIADNVCEPYTQSFIPEFSYSPQIFEDSVVQLHWDFDGNESVDRVVDATEEYVENIYTDGKYLPSLYVTTARGCASLVKSYPTKGLLVGVEPIVRNRIVDDRICASEKLVIIDSSLSASAINPELVVMSNLIARDGGVVSERTEKLSGTNSAIQVEGWSNIGIWSLHTRVYNRDCWVDNWVSGDTITVLGPFATIQETHDCDSSYKDVRAHITSLKDVDTTFWDWRMFNHDSTYYDERVALTDREMMLDTSRIGIGNYRIELIVYNDSIEECPYYKTSVYAPVRKIEPRYTPFGTERCWSDQFYFPAIEECIGTKDGGYVLNPNNNRFSLNWRSYDPDSIVTTGKFHSLEDILNRNSLVDSIDVDTILMNKPGVHTVYLQSQDLSWGCKDSVSVKFTVYKPEPFITHSIASGCEPHEVTFYDTTAVYDTTINRRIWYVDNTQFEITSGLHDSASYVFNETDTYNIKLRAETVPLYSLESHICYNEITLPVEIEALKPQAYIWVPNRKICINNEALFVRNTELHVDSLYWDFGDGSDFYYGMEDSVYHLYNTARVEPYSVTLHTFLESEYGMCENSNTVQIDVKDIQIQMLIPNPPADSCHNEAIWTFYPDSLYPAYTDFEYKWYRDGEYKESQAYSDYAFPFDYGFHEARLELVTDFKGCESVWSEPMTMFVKGVVVDFVINPQPVCINAPFTIEFTENARNMENVGFTWDMADGNTYRDFTVEHAYDFVPQNPYFVINLAIDHGATCNERSVYSDTVRLYEIMADFTVNELAENIRGCETFEVAIENTSRGSQGNTWTLNGEALQLADLDTLYLENGVYNLKLVIDNNLCEDDQVRKITVLPTPKLATVIDTLYCEADSVYLYANADSAHYSLVWTPAHLIENNTSYNPYIVDVQQSDSIFLHATNQYDCKDSVALFMNVQLRPSYNGAPYKPYQYILYDSIYTYRSADTILVNNIFNFNNEAVKGVNYLWEPSTWLSCTDCYCPNIFITDYIEESKQPLQYIVTMTNDCFVEQFYVDIVVMNEMKVDVPTGFTPNKDKSNDMLFVRGWGIKELVEFRIYNRWGQEVFYTDDIEKGWDGTYKGTEQQMGTFTYTVRVKDFKDELVTLKGHFDLLR